eukprot:scaffold255186_cov29-Tisochrysis_lutea.AAC.5
MRRVGRLSGFDVSYFFRAVLDKFDEMGEDPHCTVADVQDEIFDMVKPQVKGSAPPVYLVGYRSHVR